MSKSKLLSLSLLGLALAAAVATPAFAGRVPGPGEAVEVVLGGHTDVYEMTFRRGQVARVVVDGDGSTDLDLYVFDECGRPVASDADCTDYCVAEWRPRRTGVFRIEVRNLGPRSNLYEIRTN